MNKNVLKNKYTLLQSESNDNTTSDSNSQSEISESFNNSIDDSIINQEKRFKWQHKNQSSKKMKIDL